MFKCVILLNFKRIEKILKTLVVLTGFPSDFLKNPLPSEMRKVKTIEGADGS